MSDCEDSVLEKNLCKSCIYYVYREIKPFEENKEEWEETFNIEITEDTVIESHTCMLLNLDLDHNVIKCNKYTPIGQVNFNNNLRLFL